MRVYVSGKVTGDDDAGEKFNRADQRLRGLGMEVLDPVLVNSFLPPSLSYGERMRCCMVYMELCDAIYLLSDWEDSPGARAEKAYAEAIGKIVIYA